MFLHSIFGMQSNYRKNILQKKYVRNISEAPAARSFKSLKRFFYSVAYPQLLVKGIVCNSKWLVVMWVEHKCTKCVVYEMSCMSGPQCSKDIMQEISKRSTTSAEILKSLFCPLRPKVHSTWFHSTWFHSIHKKSITCFFSEIFKSFSHIMSGTVSKIACLCESTTRARVKQNRYCELSIALTIFLILFVWQAFNPDNEYHFKNRMKASQRNWAEVFGEDNMFAVSPSSSYQKVFWSYRCCLGLCVLLQLFRLKDGKTGFVDSRMCWT